MVKKSRSERVTSRVEPLIFTAINVVLEAYNISQSDYVRSVIIEDLKRRHLITETMLAEMVA